MKNQYNKKICRFLSSRSFICYNYKSLHKITKSATLEDLLCINALCKVFNDINLRLISKYSNGSKLY